MDRKKINLKLKQIEEMSIFSINGSNSEFLIFTEGFFQTTYPMTSRNCPVVLRLGQDQVWANLGRVSTDPHCPHSPLTVPTLFPPCLHQTWVVPCHFQKPRDSRVCNQPYVPKKHLKPRVVHFQNLVPFLASQAIPFLQAQLSNPR